MELLLSVLHFPSAWKPQGVLVVPNLVSPHLAATPVPESIAMATVVW